MLEDEASRADSNKNCLRNACGKLLCNDLIKSVMRFSQGLLIKCLRNAAGGISNSYFLKNRGFQKATI